MSVIRTACKTADRNCKPTPKSGRRAPEIRHVSRRYPGKKHFINCLTA